MEEVEQGIKLLAEKTGLSEHEIRQRMENKIAEMEGLLKPDGALYIVAAELGVDVTPTIEPRKSVLTISKLVPRMRHVRIKGRVLRIYDAMTYQKRDGTRGERVEFKICDGTGDADVVLWSKHLADVVKSGGIREGDVVEIGGARTSTWRQALTLNLDSDMGEMRVLEGDFPEYPQPSMEILGVSELGLDFGEVDVEGIVAALFPPREFTREDETKGKLASLMIRDLKTADEVRAVLWGEKADLVDGLSMGDKLRIKAARVKSSRDGWIELHLGRRSGLIVQEKAREHLSPEKAQEIEAKVLYLFETRSFRARGQTVTVRDCVAEVGGDLLLCRLWGGSASALDGVKPPARVKLLYPYEKVDGGRRIINIGKLGECIILEEGVGEVPKDIETISNRIKYQRAWLDEAAEGFREIRGTVVKTDPSARISWWCKNCGSRVTREFDQLRCESCGEVDSADGLLALSIYVDDGTGVIRATFFRDVAERLLGKNLERILDEIDEKGYEQDTYLLEELGEKLLGNDVILRGRISYEGTGILRMTVDEIQPTSPLEEAGALIKEMEERYLAGIEGPEKSPAPR